MSIQLFNSAHPVCSICLKPSANNNDAGAPPGVAGGAGGKRHGAHVVSFMAMVVMNIWFNILHQASGIRHQAPVSWLGSSHSNAARCALLLLANGQINTYTTMCLYFTYSHQFNPEDQLAHHVVAPLRILVLLLVNSMITISLTYYILPSSQNNTSIFLTPLHASTSEKD